MVLKYKCPYCYSLKGQCFGITVGKRLSKSLKVKVNFNEIENCKNNNKPEIN